MNSLTSLSRALAATGLLLLGAVPAQAEPVGSDSDAHHVLLISVDGLHASDLAQWVRTHPSSTLAQLSGVGTTYTHAMSSLPSDSFPGLLAMVTGGTPKTTGVFYDDSYARNMWAPGSNCQGAPGTETLYAENLDKSVNGLIPLWASIDPANLPLGKVNGQCVPIYPHSFLQTNTIFNVARKAGLYTAWSDKHPAYEIINGPSGLGVNDLYTPEINTSAVPDPTTVSVAATDAYDQIKVQAVLNEIDGKTSDGSRRAPVPAIFGMNFQSVSVGQKLVDPKLSCARNTSGSCDPSYFPGGYMPGSLEFTPQLLQAMTYVDGALGSMVKELKAKKLMQSTDLIVSAKHGQSPIDPTTLRKIGDPISTILAAKGIEIGQITTDDVALIWLKDQSQTAAAVAALQDDKAHRNSARVQYIVSGNVLVNRFGDPLHNARTPDLIVQPIPGTIYTSSKAKVAEHGGFAEDDIHVALLTVNGATQRGDDRSEGERGAGRTVSATVHTTQIAPTILRDLNLDPEQLKSVRLEGTEPLPR